ncbi:Npun_F0494 family protein [Acaryochloris sp. IP29b_bin.137]|uniref:Npun_F0494 family protein n=1 Tax=Acaryochloris sp. IP29b_bin.137 TaxID=2969217 RepID=UPI00262651BC|nr:Npun_F0494 family protein [Acaryochloris sp. IP29b_bin.137]
MHYPRPTINRAVRAVACSPFTIHLLATMRSHSVSLQEMCDRSGVIAGYTQTALSERQAEDTLLWLIQVGLLRREVDGQGLTDSFRLTPLGRQLVDQWQHQGKDIPNPSLADRCQNLCQRWVRIPV